MASKSRPEPSRPRPGGSVAPKVLLLALIGVSVWGVWRVLRLPAGSAVDVVAGAPPSKPAAPAPVSPPFPASAASRPTPVPVPPDPLPTSPAQRPPAVSNSAPVLVPPSPTTTTVSNAASQLPGITSAPVVLSTQLFRASLAATEPAVTNAVPVPDPSSNAASVWVPRGATNHLEAQIALAGLGISSGSIDGVGGSQTAAALKAFQMQQGLEPTGWLDRGTRKALLLKRAPLIAYRVVADDLLRLAMVPETWVGKSQAAGLEHETLLERLAERFQSHPNLLRRLNPAVDWARANEGLELVVPAIPPVPARRAALIRISLPGRFLRVFDTGGQLIAHFPCSIARRVEKRPVGDLQVVVTVPNPDYTWDPEVFPESPESRTVGRKLRIPPGPNNPVGVAWIGLDRPGYGIHGTPRPEEVGRTESHGCFRLANWNAELLRRMAWPGLTVRVEGDAPPSTASATAAEAQSPQRSRTPGSPEVSAPPAATNPVVVPP